MDGSYFFAADRGKRGRLPRLTSLADESYQEFAEGLRNWNLHGYFRQAVAPKAVMACKAAGMADVVPLTDGPKVAEVIDKIPAAQVAKRLMRSQQQMTWRNIRDSFYKRKDELLAELDRAEKTHPERLKLKKGMNIPDWAAHEIHLQPGGYVDDPLGGYVYHYGTKVFFQGINDQDDLHEKCAALMAPPKDGKVKRILDIGCSIGQFATAMKARFPDAEVHAIDVGEPMVRYAHKRALDMGLDVTFHQGLIEAAGFPDDYFDMVTSFIVFHEMPPEISKQIFQEVRRMLRPGGTFGIVDFPSMPMAPPLSAYFVDFDHRDNGEPFTVPFMMSDFPGSLQRAGFTIESGPPTFAFLETRVCTNNK